MLVSNFFFAKLIHPSQQCGRLDCLVIAQVNLRLPTIKGHSELFSFPVCAGGRKPFSILCYHHLPHAVPIDVLQVELIWLLIMACGMMIHSSSIQFMENGSRN